MFGTYLGSLVRRLEPTSEADPANILASLMAATGVYLGDGPHMRAGDGRHPLLVWPMVIGRTGVGRKGAGWSAAKRLLLATDPDFVERNIHSGLTSGEGLTQAFNEDEAGATGPDEGEEGKGKKRASLLPPGDRRLLAFETEWATVMARMKREGNTLSARGDPARPKTARTVTKREGNHRMPRKRRPEGTRAPNGASSIYLGNDGYWHGRVTMGTRDDGRPDRRHVQGKTEAEVIDKVRKLERDRDAGRMRKPGRAWTVEKWLMHWLEHIAKPSVRPKTVARYRTSVEQYLIPGLGAHRIDRLQPENIEKLYAKLLARGLAPSTVHHVHRTLRVAFNEAFKREHITKNPVLVAKAPKLVEPEIEPFTVAEAQRILDVARTRRNGARFALALALGMRQGEALGLKWSDLRITWHHGCASGLTEEQQAAIEMLAKVDPQRWKRPDDSGCGFKDVEDCPQAHPAATLNIRRALQRHTWQHGCGDKPTCGKKRGADCPQRHGGGLAIVPVKSRAGTRSISVPEPLIHALLDHDEAQDEERHLARNLWHDDGWMFAQPNGKATDPRADYGEWRELLDAAKVRPARLHDARHTAATMLLVLKVAPRAIMDVMGWSEASMLTRYVHVPDEIKQGIAGQVGGLLWKDWQQPDDGPDDEDGGTAGHPVPA